MLQDMKPMTIAGMTLIVLGLVALVYQGITYTSRETVLDIGPLHATADRQKTLRRRCWGLRRWRAAWRCWSPAVARAPRPPACGF